MCLPKGTYISSRIDSFSIVETCMYAQLATLLSNNRVGFAAQMEWLRTDSQGDRLLRFVESADLVLLQL